MIGNQPKFKYVYLGADFIILSLSFILSVTITVPNFWFVSRNIFHFYFSYFSLYVLLMGIYIFTFLYNDLYKRNIVLSRRKHMFLIIKSLASAVVICIIVMLFFNVEYLALHGKKLFINFSLYNLGLLIFSRIIIGKVIFIWISKKNIYKRRVLIVGGDQAGKHIAKTLRHDRVMDLHIVGFIDDYKEVGAKIYRDFNNLGKLNDIERVIRDSDVEEILIAIDNTPYDRMIHIVEKCLQTELIVRVYSNFLEVIGKKMKVEFYSNIPVIMLSQYSLNDYYWTIKRILDTVIASVSLIMLSPLFFLISGGIKLSSKGPVFYKQVRIGKDGRPFNFYKFRSMHVNDDDTEHEKFVKDVWFQKGDQKKEKEIKIYKITKDLRVFPFGNFIRKMSLDEFPQLVNVIKGDMNLVGPRPCMPFEWDMYEEWHRNRMNILPGCTGLWQALGRATVSFEEMVILDIYYISNMTLWLDLKIVLKTIPVILFGKGAY